MQPNGPQNNQQPQQEQPSADTLPPAQIAPSVPQPAPAQQVTAPGEKAQISVAPAMQVASHQETFAPPATENAPEQATDDEIDDSRQLLSWEASEYVHHEKDAIWFTGFAVTVIVFLTVAILLQAWTFVALIIVMAIATIVYVRRPPRNIRYTLSEKGLHIGQQFHPFASFRAFDVINDGAFYAIMLVSTKRFMPATLIYFAEQDGENIVDILGSYLPMEDLRLDFADILIRKLRL